MTLKKSTPKKTRITSFNVKGDKGDITFIPITQLELDKVMVNTLKDNEFDDLSGVEDRYGRNPLHCASMSPESTRRRRSPGPS